MSDLNEWQRIVKLYSFEKTETNWAGTAIIVVSVVDEYVQKLQSEIAELEQQLAKYNLVRVRCAGYIKDECEPFAGWLGEIKLIHDILSEVSDAN